MKKDAKKDAVSEPEIAEFEEVPIPETPVQQTRESELEDKIKELTNDLQRTRADFENYRKQVDAQKTQAMTLAQNLTVEKFLPLVDDLERAFTTYKKELQPLAKSFTKTLHSLGLEQIESSPDTEFNPDFHEAISVEDDEGDREIISETLRPGYLYNGNVLRAALVKVRHSKSNK